MCACKSCSGTSGGPSIEALPLASSSSTCSSCSHPVTSCTCDSCECSACTSYCQEDHNTVVLKKRYSFTLRVKPSFVWPAPEETVSLVVDSTDRLLPGSILWNPTAGYLVVDSFDYTTQTVVASNPNSPCSGYSGGETLPECTEFVVGPPQCGSGTTPIPNIPYLAADFISPADTECALASVTNITGLTINDTVSVNGYEYTLGDIIDTDTIELCNDGGGAPEGTVIQWDDDGDGVPNIPILVTASENPCTRTGIIAGVLLACDGSDVARPLVGSVAGQIPVWDTVTQRFELINVGLPFTSCTSLLVDFTVDPIHVGSYIVVVVSTADFTVGDTLLIDGLSYVINVIDDVNNMHITPLITPLAIETYSAGFPVCLYYDPTAGLLNVQSENHISAAFDLTGLDGGETVSTGAAITNPSLSRDLHVMANYNAYVRFEVDNFFIGQALLDILVDTNGGGFMKLFVPVISVLAGGAALTRGAAVHGDKTYIVAPGATLTLSTKASFQSDPAAQLFISGALYMEFKFLAVAV